MKEFIFNDGFVFEADDDSTLNNIVKRFDTYSSAEDVVNRSFDDNISSFIFDGKNYQGMKIYNLSVSRQNDGTYLFEMELTVGNVVDMMEVMNAMQDRINELESSQSDQDDALVELADIIAG